jgi:hypothetical protein
MRDLATVAGLNEYGRTRLSRNFFMREMLYSEVSNVHGVPNIPEDPDLAIEVGRRFCENVLEPLHERFGKVGVRSAYRSPKLNNYCHERYKAGDTACWCTENESNYAKHIWDQRDADGHLGATATVFIPAYLDHYERSGGDYRPLAWWIRDHLPGYAGASFFRPLCAFNIRWYEGETDKAIWFIDPPQQVMLTRRGNPDFDGDHSSEYADIIG